jgi:SAM-dependent methyltransferase
VDISADAVMSHPNLDERIVGDLETVDLGSDRFDVAVCWDVLEHLRRPERAVANIRAALKPGGYLILGLPNTRSAKALVARVTPHRFHVWFYRRVMGQGEVEPHPTVMRPMLRPSALLRHFSTHGWKVLYEVRYEGWPQKTLRYRLGLVEKRWDVAKRIARLLTAGAVDPEATDVIVIAQRRDELSR